MYYFESLKKSLSEPTLTPEQLQALIQESEFFLRVLQVKLESANPELRTEATSELKALRTLLENR